VCFLPTESKACEVEFEEGRAPISESREWGHSLMKQKHVGKNTVRSKWRNLKIRMGTFLQHSWSTLGDNI